MTPAPAVGIVLVSHSAELAQGAAHLAAQVSGGTVTIIAAGGTDEGELGTSEAKSVLGVMGLGATSGQHVTVYAAGPDAREAVAALITILSEATKVGG